MLRPCYAVCQISPFVRTIIRSCKADLAWGHSVALHNPRRVQDLLHPRIDVFPYKERYVILYAFAAHPKLFA
jgi:hypothetical protein